ncbi:MAG: squalene synthase HpnC [Betaproteobacteria bacterium]|nr:squalene synthase HpnC [Betaproteobacteria bacterium]
MAVDHYENFPVASILMPAHLRHPVSLIYRFARTADDFADEGDLPPAERLALLRNFERELDRIEAGQAPGIPWFADLAQIIRLHQLPMQLFRDLLSAFSQDVAQCRYADYASVLDYCRRSANPIGRLLLVLYGKASEQNNAWGDAICTSLQLINFWQDVAIDYRKNRIYFPQDDMARYGITEQHIATHDSGGRWREFMTFQVERARALLQSGAPLGRVLKGRLGLEMRLIIAGGDRILTKIGKVDYDVFRCRPVLKPHDWLLMFARSAFA